MRFKSLLLGGISFGVLVLSGLATAEDTSRTAEPDIHVVASFPEDNPFGHVVNGEKNRISLAIENRSDLNVTLTSIGGSFHHPESHALIKNTTIAKVVLPFHSGSKVVLPYAFYSEYKPGDLRLNIWLEHAVDGETYRVSAYDSIVTVVEPESSLLDFKMLSTYLVIAAILGGSSYFVYFSLFPPSKKQRAKRQVPTPSSDTVTTAGSSTGYQEEWIPVHHLKKGKTSKTATSGDELSGGEASATEGKKRRKGKK